MASEAYKAVEANDPRKPWEWSVVGPAGRYEFQGPDSRHVAQECAAVANVAHNHALRSLASAAPLDLTQFEGMCDDRCESQIPCRHSLKWIESEDAIKSEILRLRAVEAGLRGALGRIVNDDPLQHGDGGPYERTKNVARAALSPEVPRLIRLPSERDAALATLRRARDEAAVALAVGIDPNDLIAPGNLLAAFHAARVDLDAAEKEQPK